MFLSWRAAVKSTSPHLLHPFCAKDLNNNHKGGLHILLHQLAYKPFLLTIFVSISRNKLNSALILNFFLAWLCGHQPSRVCWISFIYYKAIYFRRVRRQDVATGQFYPWGISHCVCELRWVRKLLLYLYHHDDTCMENETSCIVRKKIICQYCATTYLFFWLAYVCLRLKLACSSHQETHFLKCK